MSAVEVAIGVVDGQVVAKWREPTTEIVFDPANAYSVGRALVLAAEGVARGRGRDIEADVRESGGETSAPNVTEDRRLFLVNMAATAVKTLQMQGKTPGFIALTVVDMVLGEVG